MFLLSILILASALVVLVLGILDLAYDGIYKVTEKISKSRAFHFMSSTG